MYAYPVSFFLTDDAVRVWTVPPQSSRRCYRFVHSRAMLHQKQNHKQARNELNSTTPLIARAQQTDIKKGAPCACCCFSTRQPFSPVPCTPYSARLSMAQETSVVTSSRLPTSGCTKRINDTERSEIRRYETARGSSERRAEPSAKQRAKANKNMVYRRRTPPKSNNSKTTQQTPEEDSLFVPRAPVGWSPLVQLVKQVLSYA